MVGPEQVAERQSAKPTKLILDAIDTHLAAIVACTLRTEDIEERERAFVEEIMSKPEEITREDLIKFIKLATLRGEPIVDPNQHVSPYSPATAFRRRLSL